MNMRSLLASYDRRLPRYTSYPTAAQFTSAVGASAMSSWLAALADQDTLSLYFHVPFCHSLCWFCGCSTSVVHSVDVLERYVSGIQHEICLVSAAIGRKLSVRQIHWGGGTPSTLPLGAMLDITNTLRENFRLSSDLETSVEVDPRTLTASALESFRCIGITRASLGVQDFAPEVQAAIGRHQTFSQTKEASIFLRESGARSINLDLIYGLPHQTVESLLETIDKALEISPDRIALYGYAHVPWMQKRQKVIPEEALPSLAERYIQQEAAAEKIVGAGYKAVGLDHFAKPNDSLSLACEVGRVRRNFQGYTVDDSQILLGFGASSISTLPQGYAQNAHNVADYWNAIEGGNLATARGIVLTEEDCLRRSIIERLMCDLTVDVSAICTDHGFSEEVVGDADKILETLAADGLIIRAGAKVIVRSSARPFLRHVASAFDAYIESPAARHAAAI